MRGLGEGGSFVTFRNFLFYFLTKSKSIYIFLRQIVLHSKNHIKRFVLKCPVDFISNLETEFRKGRLFSWIVYLSKNSIRVSQIKFWDLIFYFERRRALQVYWVMKCTPPPPPPPLPIPQYTNPAPFGLLFKILFLIPKLISRQ